MTAGKLREAESINKHTLLVLSKEYGIKRDYRRIMEKQVETTTLHYDSVYAGVMVGSRGI